MQFILYTTSRSQKVREAAERWALGLMKSKGRAPVTVEIRYFRPGTVKLAKDDKGRTMLDWDWFATQFQGEEGVGLHFLPSHRKEWKLAPTVNGRRNTESKDKPMLWLCADTSAMAKGYQNLTEIERLLYHEMAHHDEDADNLVGDALPQEWVHNLDYNEKAIDRYPEQISFTEIKARMTLRDALAEISRRLLQKKTEPVELLNPVQMTPLRITQAYGVKSSRYPRTGRHIGIDYGIPVGTRLYAPWEGSVTAAGNHPQLGGWCQYRYTYEGRQYEERWAHLSTLPVIRTYKRGEIVCHSGNTGQSTGPHLHLEVWPEAVRVDLINSRNWVELTLDPAVHYNL